MNIAILGGAFDPPHKGHIKTAQLALETCAIGQSWLMPCFSHLYDKKMESPEHRYEMCRLAVEKCKNILVSRFEIDNELTSGTYDMLSKLKVEYPQHNFFFVIGTDNADTIHKWRNSEALLAENHFIVIPRKGYQADPSVTWYKNVVKGGKTHKFLSDGTTISVSSTEIRLSLKNDPTLAGRLGQLNESVKEYIFEHNLYGVES
jgi:nicotinate-nucleotide adenylyltransferase